MAAAVAAECAHQQGRFLELQRVIFARQRELSGVSWHDLGRQASIRDLEQFARCVQLPSDSVPRIAYGLLLGEKSGVRGTPTVWVNGAAGQRSLEQLRQTVLTAKKK